MKLKPPILIASTVISIHPGSALADHGNFHCERIPFLNERAVSAVNKLSHNKTMSVIVKQYAEKWEDEEIVRTCKAAAAGKSADFTCMQGRRDWSAIKDMVPESYFSMDPATLRPFQLEFQKQRAKERPREAALKQCEALGVMKR
ncbi:hypothetical protein [Ahrensia marina]|uniref:Uncharacterized protein n=1 Tax=Ahrensia marina TaxID=1514904 RepID=A0A0M9GM25_9HYPH|nr:hypothetical protein [Ahrensia marina]KPB00616.1 hypothetical protein SU32_12345 [Ahrensia marina]